MNKTTLTVSEMFNRLYAATLRSAPAIQRREMRKAFFSGAWEILERMPAIAATETEESAARFFESWREKIQRELTLYGAEFEQRPSGDATL